MRGFEDLRRARGELAAPGGERRRLRAAARAFDAAADEAGGWPLRFRIKADLIRRRLGGPGQADKAVAGMTEAEVAAAAAELRLLCEEAERAARGFAGP